MEMYFKKMVITSPIKSIDEGTEPVWRETVQYLRDSSVDIMTLARKLVASNGKAIAISETESLTEGDLKRYVDAYKHQVVKFSNYVLKNAGKGKSRKTNKPSEPNVKPQYISDQLREFLQEADLGGVEKLKEFEVITKHGISDKKINLKLFHLYIEHQKLKHPDNKSRIKVDKLFEKHFSDCTPRFNGKEIDLDELNLDGLTESQKDTISRKIDGCDKSVKKRIGKLTNKKGVAFFDSDGYSQDAIMKIKSFFELPDAFFNEKRVEKLKDYNDELLSLHMKLTERDY